MMDQREWKNEYPKMPESFHLALQEAVERNMDTDAAEETVQINLQDLLKKRNEIPPVIRKKKGWKKLYLFGIAATLTLGIAVAGVTATQIMKEKEEFDFAKYLGYESRDGIEELFQKDMEVIIAEEAALPLLVNEYEDDKQKEEYIYWWKSNQKEREDNVPLMEIKEIMYDGMEFAVHAIVTDAGEEYVLGADAINIGKESIALSHGGKTGEGRDCVFVTHLCDVERETPFEVTIPLGVYKNGERYENQDYTFTVDVDAKMTELEEQEFILESCTVQVSELVKSQTAIMGKIEVCMTEEQKAAYENSDRQLLHMALFKSVDGTIWKSIGVLETGPYNIIYEPDSLVWYFHEQMPEPDSESVMLYLLSFEKSSKGEKFDMWAPENIWGEGMKILLTEEE